MTFYLYEASIPYMYFLIRILPCLLILIEATSSHGQQVHGKEAVLYLSETADFDLTGSGTDAAWKAGEWITLSRIKGTSDYETRAKLLYSETGIYVLFHCEDKKITATLKEDFTSLWQEDVVEIFFWPDESIPVYLEYELSPLNFELAILVTNVEGKTSAWMPWNYRGRKKTRKATSLVGDPKNPTGWIGEFFIPYALLPQVRNVPPQKGTRWRANFYRIDYDDPGSSYWSWQPVNNNFHEFMKYGTFVFD